MSLGEFLFGSDPEFSVEQLFTPQDVLNTFNLYQGQAGGLLELLTRGAFNQAAAFGPGFQGGIGTSVANAQNAGLMQLLGLALATEDRSRESFVTQGSAGLFPTMMAGAAGGLGQGLGASLFGGGFGGGLSAGNNNSFQQAGIFEQTPFEDRR